MADEPKNNIEDALKAYARKRREEAGAFEMHPATRQMLHSEAAKLRAKSSTPGRRSWLVGLFEFGPRWGFALSILVVLAVMYLAWRSPSSRMEMASRQTKAPAAANDRLSESISTRSESDSLHVAKDFEKKRAILSEELREEQLTAEAEQLGRSSDFRKNEAADKKVKLGVEVALHDRTAGEPMPAAPVPAPAEPAPVAERSLALRDTDAFQRQKLSNDLSGARVLAGAAPVATIDTNMTLLSAAASASNTEQFNERMSYAGAPPSTVQQRFYKAQSPERGEQSAARLLEDFELQRTGNEIRIIDSDGSLYQGAVYDGTYLAQSKESEARKDDASLEPAKRQLPVPNVPTADQPRPTATAGAVADTMVRFRATGTNRTLNQLVVFDGAMRSATTVPTQAYFADTVQAQSGEAAPVRAAQEPAGGKTLATQARRAQRFAQTASNRIVRVEGKARVGATNQLEINALPR